MRIKRDYFVAATIRSGKSVRSWPVWIGRATRTRSALRRARRGLRNAVSERPGSVLEAVGVYFSIDCPHRPTHARTFEVSG